MTKAARNLVTDPSGGEWSWYRRSDGKYQVTSVEVPTYGFALTRTDLHNSHSESMKAVWWAIVLTERPQCEWMLFCEGGARSLVAHPVLDLVPTCQHCVDTFALEPVFTATIDTRENVDCPVCGSRVYRGAVRCGGCGSYRPSVAGWATMPTSAMTTEVRPVTLPQGGDESGTVVTVTEDGSTVVRPI